MVSVFSLHELLHCNTHHGSPETSAHPTTQLRLPEEVTLQQYRCESLKSLTIIYFLSLPNFLQFFLFPLFIPSIFFYLF